MLHEVPLRGTLKHYDPELSGRLPRIERSAKTLLSYTHGKFPYYTPHNFSHSLNVEKNLDWMIGDNVKKEMNAIEIFFLLVAAWMHDWGMIGKPKENCKEIREAHHLRTEKNFQKMYDKLFLSEHEGRIIGRICRGHTKEDLYDKDFDDQVFGSNIKIRVRFLAAILRIADECDVTCNRTPEIVYYSLNPSGKSEEEFKKNLSISGVGRLEEKHKIYIFGVAKDPRGAKTLHELRDKIQQELDTVKTILAAYQVPFDSVELKLESRGFIDKPIGFEVNKKKLIELLISEHLYSRNDVAIREMLQNAVDACRLRKSFEPDYSPEIRIYRDRDKLIVEDDGYGMDFETVKKHLSSIGSSFYTSEDFKKLTEKAKFDPISRFGIGVLSYFLIARSVTIETKTEGKKPCCFIIGDIQEEWRYEEGSREKSGTKITLFLNKDGKKIDVGKSLLHYAKAIEIPIRIFRKSGEKMAFTPKWDARMEEIDPFLVGEERNRCTIESIFLRTDSLDVDIYRYDNIPEGQNFFLANQGIFVNSCSVSLLGLKEHSFIILINLKKDMMDLEISRESVVNNQRFAMVVKELRKLLLTYLETRVQKEAKLKGNSSFEEAMLFHRTLNEFFGHIYVYDHEEEEFLAEFFGDKTRYPVIYNTGVRLVRLNDIFRDKSITKAYEYPLLFEPEDVETSIVKNLCQKTNVKDEAIVINPCKITWSISRFKNPISPVHYFSIQEKKLIEKTSLSAIIQRGRYTEIETPLDSLLPSWCFFAKLPKETRGLILQVKPFVLRHDLPPGYSGHQYPLWEALWLSEEELLGFSPYYSSYYKEEKKRIVDNLVSQPKFLFDASDPMILLLLKHEKDVLSDDKIKNLVVLYFKILLLSQLEYHFSAWRHFRSFLERIILSVIKEEREYQCPEERSGETALDVFRILKGYYPLNCYEKK